MKIGLIGVGVVGGALKTWLEKNTTHMVCCYDPGKGMSDDLAGCTHIFISVPVPASGQGQDLRVLGEAVSMAKKYTDKVFVRSTVLPGTNDMLGTIAMPEFLTERRAYDDFFKLPLLIGCKKLKYQEQQDICQKIFNGKSMLVCSNIEAELSKFTHNCFGAVKVTYFNMIRTLADKLGADYDVVKFCSNLTGFLGNQHMEVPGPDGKRGYGGRCFPENMSAIFKWLNNQPSGLHLETVFFRNIIELNEKYRGRE